MKKRRKKKAKKFRGSRWSPWGEEDRTRVSLPPLRPVLFSELPSDLVTVPRSEANRAAIYALTDPITGEIRYIGKTTQRSDVRLRQHLEAPTNANMRRWFDILRASGREPKIRLITCCPVAEWQRHESRWIRWAREAGARLLNVDPGGACRDRGGGLNTYGRTKRFVRRRDGVGFRTGAARDVWRSS